MEIRKSDELVALKTVRECKNREVRQPHPNMPKDDPLPRDRKREVAMLCSRNAPKW
jgi:hypothetical protein